jgi:hypothetical protein
MMWYNTYHIEPVKYRILSCQNGLFVASCYNRVVRREDKWGGRKVFRTLPASLPPTPLYQIRDYADSIEKIFGNIFDSLATSGKRTRKDDEKGKC